MTREKPTTAKVDGGGTVWTPPKQDIKPDPPPQSNISVQVSVLFKKDACKKIEYWLAENGRQTSESRVFPLKNGRISWNKTFSSFFKRDVSAKIAISCIDGAKFSWNVRSWHYNPEYERKDSVIILVSTKYDDPEEAVNGSPPATTLTEREGKDAKMLYVSVKFIR